MTSAIPAGTRLLGIAIEDGLATVDLSGEFLNDLGEDTALRVAQVVFTATQFPTVDRVTHPGRGHPGPDASASTPCPSCEVDRADFEEQTPFVLVESPTPGEAVTSPVRVTGTSPTPSRPTCVYEVTDADGRGRSTTGSRRRPRGPGRGAPSTYHRSTPAAGDVVLTRLPGERRGREPVETSTRCR